jgi:hypothetical protein
MTGGWQMIVEVTDPYGAEYKFNEQRRGDNTI